MRFPKGRMARTQGLSLWQSLGLVPVPEAREKEIEFQGVGRVLFRKEARSHRMRIRVRPNQPVLVLVPESSDFARAESWVFSKLPWIRSAVEKMDRPEFKPTVFLPGTTFKTHSRQLRIIPGEGDKVLVRISPSFVDVHLPPGLEPGSAKVQSLIRSGITKALQLEAKAFLPDRVELLARQHGFSFQSIGLRDNKSRWGSCSVDNKLNLNIHLMRLSPGLIDYVILHELVHTVHKNHGPAFWKHLEQVLPGARAMDKELNAFRTQVY